MKTEEMIVTMKNLEARVSELEERIKNLKVRDRGPTSTRSMTRMDAWRCIHGDLKEKSHKEAAAALGLSYGQIYSARGEYTFKDIKKDDFTEADVKKINEA